MSRGGARRERPSRRLGWMAAAAALATLLAPLVASAQQEIFERGNVLYQEADYAGAIEAYENVLAAGYDGPDLRYNLGNAYFKAGRLGRSILEWERALERAPGDPDVLANLELARSLTADAIEPMPRFWLLGAVSWWVNLMPRGMLVLTVAATWLLGAGAVIAWILARGRPSRGVWAWVALAGLTAFALFGTNLAARALGIGAADEAIVMTAAVSVRSAPADADDLTLFEIHEGTKVRVGQRAGEWSEIVLADGKVGWVPAEVIEEI